MMFIGTEKGRYTVRVIKGAAFLLCFRSNAGPVTNRGSATTAVQTALVKGKRLKNSS